MREVFEADMRESVGHLGFRDGFEYVQMPSGDVYRASVKYPVRIDGYRGGLRFEGTAAWWERFNALA